MVEGTDHTTGSKPRHPITVINIDVSDDDIDVDVTDDWLSSKDRRKVLDRTQPALPRKLKLAGGELTPQRRGAISLLATLLHYHSDQDMADKISDELYRELLSVVGQELFSLLFVGELHGEVAKALGKLNEGELELLRIKLWFSGRNEDWLAGLPWEYVRTPTGDTELGGGVFLSQHAELVLSRRVHPTLREWQTPVTVLLVSPSPRKREVAKDGRPSDEWLDPVDPGKVVDTLLEFEERGLISLQELVDHPPNAPAADYEWVTRRRLKERMKDEPEPVLVHFVGHGRSREGHGELLLAKEDGSADWVRDEDFARIVGRSNTVKLVFLQACESASSGIPDPYVSFSGVARQLAAVGLPAVIAMQYRIKAELATAFAAAFYDALIANDRPVDVAVEAGRQAIQEIHDDRDRLAFGLPVVYLTGDHGGIAARVHRGPTHTRGDEFKRERRSCPRCQTPLQTQDKACTYCGLKLRCLNPDCVEKPWFRDPIQDRFCPECAAPANQTPWAPDVEEAVASAPSSEAAGGVLSVLNPDRAEPGGVNRQ